MREFKMYEILFENSLRNFYNLYFIPPRTKKVFIVQVIYFVRNVTSFLRQSFMRWLVGPCWLEAGEILQHPHSLLGTTDYWLLVTARPITGPDWSPALLVRNNLHTLSGQWIAGDKTEGNIKIKWWVESCHLMSWVETFQFFCGSRQAVGGKNIFLKLPHINIRSTAAKIRTEWNLFIHVKHHFSA